MIYIIDYVHNLNIVSSFFSPFFCCFILMRAGGVCKFTTIYTVSNKNVLIFFIVYLM